MSNYYGDGFPVDFRWNSGGLPVELDNSIHSISLFYREMEVERSPDPPQGNHRRRMKAQLETHDGRVTLKVYYDPALCNLDEAISASLASFGLKHGQAAILAFPFHPSAGTTEPDNQSDILSDF